MTEQDAYQSYYKECTNVRIEGGYITQLSFVQPFNFNEWRAMGRPKSLNVKDGYYPTPWPQEGNAASYADLTVPLVIKS